MEAIEFFEVIGIICAVLALLITTYAWVFKLGGLVTKVNLMWYIYVVEILSEARKNKLVQRGSSYKITNNGSAILGNEIREVISNFAKSNKKLKDKSETKIFNEFIQSREYRKIGDLIIKSVETKNIDAKAFFGLVLAYTVEQIKKSE